MQIFGNAHHHKFICIEYQHFRDVICNILDSMANSNMTGIMTIKFAVIVPPN